MRPQWGNLKTRVSLKIRRKPPRRTLMVCVPAPPASPTLCLSRTASSGSDSDSDCIEDQRLAHVDAGADAEAELHALLAHLPPPYAFTMSGVL
jgi:hypothetical protein